MAQPPEGNRAYLEIPILQNLTLAETLANRSLETFQEFDDLRSVTDHRRKLQANAHKLLDEIHTAKNDVEAAVRWQSLPEWESFMQSREIYVAIDLMGKVEEIDFLSERLRQRLLG